MVIPRKIRPFPKRLLQNGMARKCLKTGDRLLLENKFESRGFLEITSFVHTHVFVLFWNKKKKTSDKQAIYSYEKILSRLITVVLLKRTARIKIPARTVLKPT